MDLCRSLCEDQPLSAPQLPADPLTYESMDEVRDAIKDTILGAVRVSDIGYRWMALLALRKAAADAAVLSQWPSSKAAGESSKAASSRQSVTGKAPEAEPEPWEHPLFLGKRGRAKALSAARLNLKQYLPTVKFIKHHF